MSNIHKHFENRLLAYHNMGYDTQSCTRRLGSNLDVDQKVGSRYLDCKFKAKF